MTKAEFIELAGGKSKYKAFLEAMGYNKRNLDRYKLEDKLTPRFIKRLNEYLAKNTHLHSSNAQKANKDTHLKDDNTQKHTHFNKKTTQNKKMCNTKDDKNTHFKTENTQNDKMCKQVNSKNTHFEEISNKDYHSSDNLSASRIVSFLKNPLDYYHRYVARDYKQEKTDALIIGSLHHTLVLEPEKLNDEYVVLDIPARAVKKDLLNAIEVLGYELDYKENSKGETVCTQTVEELKSILSELKEKSLKDIVMQKHIDIAKVTAEKALKSVFEFVHPTTGEILFSHKLEDILKLDECYVEKTFYGTINGVEFQVRPDILVNLSKSTKRWFVIDLKTSENATLREFESSLSKYYYDMQEWIYREVLRQNGIEVFEFSFCVAGKSEISNAEYYTINKHDIEKVGEAVIKILEKYKYCKENNIWREGKYDYEKRRFKSKAVASVATWRHFELIKMGVE